MRSAAIRQQIETRTEQAFGRHVWPHLFRDCAVTELVDCAPEEIGIAPDLLGHADLQTTKKLYIQAVGVKAHARVQEVNAARRRAATSRGTSGASRGTPGDGSSTRQEGDGSSTRQEGYDDEQHDQWRSTSCPQK
jgi:hypothetical protein